MASIVVKHPRIKKGKECSLFLFLSLALSLSLSLSLALSRSLSRYFVSVLSFSFGSLNQCSLFLPLLLKCYFFTFISPKVGKGENFMGIWWRICSNKRTTYSLRNNWEHKFTETDSFYLTHEMELNLRVRYSLFEPIHTT